MNSDYTEMSAGEERGDDRSRERRISERVILSVAAAKGENPVEMQPALYDAIDPDALDTLFESERVSVEFSWQNYRIVIDENGTIHTSRVK